ncbi:hypothetical protein BQ8794_550011 [Mesorhizobium prunaredense]|uniref:Uncharacterized protein n=1 Tax=Mesorhizobium prunaredense TaxID=1631249 RepID=A0A1R3VFH9_9HYPH|nr:hypothetical protein BQ8794_550011 [Mesorhizobium prunaredense]
MRHRTNNEATGYQGKDHDRPIKPSAAPALRRDIRRRISHFQGGGSRASWPTIPII